MKASESYRKGWRNLKEKRLQINNNLSVKIDYKSQL